MGNRGRMGPHLRPCNLRGQTATNGNKEAERRIYWGAVQKYIEEEGDKAASFDEVGEAYRVLVRLKRQRPEREVVITGRSKPWWKVEWKELRKGARKKLRNEIRKAERTMWTN